MSGFVLGLVIEYLFVYKIEESRTISAQSHFLPHNLPPKTHTIFFFSRTLSEGLAMVQPGFNPAVCVKVIGQENRIIIVPY